MLLRRSVQLYGEDAPVTLDLKRQLQELQQFQAGFRAQRREASP